MRADSIVLKTIKERKLIDEGDILLLGFSGGPDSLCLLDILTKLQPVLKFKLYALHVNHKIRGDEADRDMNAAILQCKDRNIPIAVKIADIPAIAEAQGIGEEAAGRIVRAKALRKQARKLKEKNPDHRIRIVLAHNKDDQAETVLMRILRGSGVHGIAAMEYERDDGFIRPLLDVPRNLIEEYCEDNGLNPSIDSSNSSTEYTRNKLRLELIPLLEKEYNPSVKDSLVRLAESAREDDDYLDSVARRSMPRMIIKGAGSKEEDWSSMPRKQLASMDPAVAKRVIKLMLARNGLKHDISSVHLNALLDAIKGNGTGLIEFPRGYSVSVFHESVKFNAPEKQEPKKKKHKSIKVYCRVLPVEELPPLKTFGADMCALDALKLLALETDLYVRQRRSGDKIRPLGLGGTKKLQDYMTDRKIPREKRDDISLLCANHEVLWIKGYTVSELFKIDEDTDFVLVVKIQED